MLVKIIITAVIFKKKMSYQKGKIFFIGVETTLALFIFKGV
jgi:hypothetical protein